MSDQTPLEFDEEFAENQEEKSGCLQLIFFFGCPAFGILLGAIITGLLLPNAVNFHQIIAYSFLPIAFILFYFAVEGFNIFKIAIHLLKAAFNKEARTYLTEVPKENTFPGILGVVIWSLLCGVVLALLNKNSVSIGYTVMIYGLTGLIWAFFLRFLYNSHLLPAIDDDLKLTEEN